MAETNSTAIPPRVKDLTGKVFGWLTVLYYAGLDKWRQARWLCQCECGAVNEVRGGDLTQGKTKSCGCHRRDARRASNTTHGMKGTPEYTAWQSIHSRCKYQNRPSYKNYGERGIAVCERWQSFEVFYADMGPRPSSRHTIERINNDLGYSKGNCKWATRAEQRRNARNTHFITLHGKTQCLKDWADELGINYRTLQARLCSGWSIERAFSEPVDHSHHPKDQLPQG